MDEVQRLPVARVSRKWSVASTGGAILSAFLASACCLGPLIFAVLGIGGAGLLEPYRPYFAGLTLGLLGLGFYFTYRAPRTSAASGADGECACEHPRSSRVGRILLWLATALVVAFLSFPYVAARLFE
jgi:mercuric ion transport protein